ncbi:MAG: hypothetical protein H7Y36_00965, partial [Armatimonadetes bacterium]|nr:hypothetical protein [Akkermansiaceae bacterium]
AVAVDPGSGKILLLSKRTEPPILYELPLRPESNAASIASRIGTTEVNAPIPSFIPYRNQPTGMDISADSSVAAVVTYYGVFLYARKPKQTWPEAFAAKPAKLGSHGLHQAEAIALSSDGDTIFVISEGPSSPITRFLRSD